MTIHEPQTLCAKPIYLRAGIGYGRIKYVDGNVEFAIGRCYEDDCGHETILYVSVEIARPVLLQVAAEVEAIQAKRSAPIRAIN